MAALTKDRSTGAREGKSYSLGVKAATLIFGGSIVCRDAAGFAVPGATAATLVVLGRAERRFDNSAGANDAIAAEYWPGTYLWNNSAAGDLIGRTEIGTQVFLVDDNTVAKTSGGATRSVAGVCVAIEPTGQVWVTTGIAKP